MHHQPGFFEPTSLIFYYLNSSLVLLLSLFYLRLCGMYRCQKFQRRFIYCERRGCQRICVTDSFAKMFDGVISCRIESNFVHGNPEDRRFEICAWNETLRAVF